MILKEVPEDFVVTERMPVCWADAGRYTYYLLSKRDHTTPNAIRMLAQLLQKKEKDIGIAGNKDRVAVTQQVISVREGPPHDIRIAADVNAKFLGRSYRPLSLGMHVGNEFAIVVRNLPSEIGLALPNPMFVNIFGEQRFSTDNAAIGKAIVKRDFVTAASLASRTHVSVASALQDAPSNPLSALRTLPLRLLKLFVHSYQSYLWNAAASEASTNISSNHSGLESSREMTLPLPGFAMTPSSFVAKQMEMEKVTQQDFIIRSIPDLSAEGGERAVFATAQDLHINLSPDEKYPGKNKATLSFFLSKGCYATVFVKHLFGNGIDKTLSA